MIECNGDDLRNLAPLIYRKYRELEQLETDIANLNRAAFPRGANAVVYDSRTGIRTPVTIGDRSGIEVYVTDESGITAPVRADHLILVDKIPGER